MIISNFFESLLNADQQSARVNEDKNHTIFVNENKKAIYTWHE